MKFNSDGKEGQKNGAYVEIDFRQGPKTAAGLQACIHASLMRVSPQSAIATNGVRVRETLRLTDDGRFKGSAIFSERKWKSHTESFTGRWRAEEITNPKTREFAGSDEFIELAMDGNGRLPARTLKFMLIRSLPAFTDVLTTTFAPIDRQAEVYKDMYHKAYRPPWN